MSPANDNEFMHWPWWRWCLEFSTLPLFWSLGIALLVLISVLVGP